MEQKVQMITSFFIRTIGPILLRGAVGGTGGTTNTASRSKPTDDDDFDDFASSEETGTKSNVKISLPTFAPDSAEDENDDDDKNASSLTKPAINTRASEPARINLLDSSFDNDKSPSSTLSAPPSYLPTLEKDDFDSVR